MSKNSLRNTKQKYPQEIKEKTIHMKKCLPKNISQQLYIDALQTAKVILGIGPAGTGKSFVAASVALEKLLSNEIDKIILSRPIVEAGEHLGYLPGGISEKVHPYMTPLLDSLEAHVGIKMLNTLLDDNRIEVAPLAFMRGRTFSNSFVLLDESENASKEQMKMFLTRLGYNTTLAINGDHTQTDLGTRQENGLSWAARKLRGVDPDISIIEFSKSDIVRNPLISKIITHLDSPDKHSENDNVKKLHPVLLNEKL